MCQEPEEQRERGAEQETGDDWEIERGVFAAMDDVAGKSAEAQRESSAEVKKGTDDSEEDAENKEGVAKFAERIHQRDSRRNEVIRRIGKSGVTNTDLHKGYAYKPVSSRPIPRPWEQVRYAR
jgi:hypothetical protein